MLQAFHWRQCRLHSAPNGGDDGDEDVAAAAAVPPAGDGGGHPIGGGDYVSQSGDGDSECDPRCGLRCVCCAADSSEYAARWCL